MDNALSSETIQELRRLGVISKTETAISLDDLFVAEDVITRSRRLIQLPTHLVETARGKRVLRG